MHIEFPDKTVIVTGAAHGFGRAIALAFAQRGAHVWACDVLADELAQTAELCHAAGGRCEVRTVDVTDRDAIFAFVREAEAAAPTGRAPHIWRAMMSMSVFEAIPFENSSLAFFWKSSRSLLALVYRAVFSVLLVEPSAFLK